MLFPAICFAVWQLAACSSDHPGVIESIPGPPNLELRHGFGASSTYFNSKTNASKNSTVILQSTFGEIQIRCKALYAIDLTFNGHKTNRAIQVTVHRAGENVTVEATTPAFEQATGMYSCLSVDNPLVFSSFYLYVPPQIPSLLLLRSQTIIVKPKFDDQSIFIPCPSTSEKSKGLIHLFKKHSNAENQDKWILVVRASYDPRKGFQITNHAHTPGTYQCISVLTNEDSVTVIVEPFDHFKVTPHQKTVYFRENQRFKGQCESSEKIDVTPQLQSKVETNVSIQSNLSYYVLHFETQPLTKEQHGSEIICKRVNSSTEYWSWTLMFEESPETRTHTGRRSAVMSECVRSYHGEIKSAECNSWVECKMRRCQRYDLECESEGDVPLPNGMLECVSNMTAPVSLTYFRGLRSSKEITEWHEASMDDILTLNVEVVLHFRPMKQLTIPITNNLSPTKTLKYVCQGSRFVFAHDFQWTLTFSGNGTEESKNETVPPEEIKHSFGNSSAVIQSEYKLNRADVLVVTCSAPVWNSTQFVTRSLHMNDVWKSGNSSSGNHVSAGTKLNLFPLIPIVFLFILYIA